jgi:hypothetical protein
MRRAATALLLLALAGACAGEVGGSLVYAVQQPPVGSGPELRAALSGTAPMTVIGSPPDGAAPEDVAAGLRTPAAYGGGGFRLVPTDAALGRVVIAFGRFNGPELCASPVLAAPAARTTVTAGFCRGTVPVSLGVLDSRTLRGPSDPAFAGEMQSLLSAVLIPAPNRSRRN